MTARIQSEALVRLEGVSKFFNGAAALSSVDIAIPSGSTTALLGTSGCGKSTILRIISGLLQPDSGRITFGGELGNAIDIAMLRQRIGYVIQDGGLFPHLTSTRNVSLMADHLGWSAARIRMRIEALAHLVQIDEHMLAKYPHELSGGQRQRVGLMRALMLEPELLLLDEPLGALDPITRFDLQRDLKSIFAAFGRTVLLVTHDLGEAFYLGDRIVLLHDGVVVQAGTCDDLVHRPATPFVTRFINAQRIPEIECGARS